MGYYKFVTGYFETQTVTFKFNAGYLLKQMISNFS